MATPYHPDIAGRIEKISEIKFSANYNADYRHIALADERGRTISLMLWEDSATGPRIKMWKVGQVR
jgi:hypothetical protein